jgi:hypothetical protein
VPVPTESVDHPLITNPAFTKVGGVTDSVAPIVATWNAGGYFPQLVSNMIDAVFGAAHVTASMDVTA